MRTRTRSGSRTDCFLPTSPAPGSSKSSATTLRRLGSNSKWFGTTTAPDTRAYATLTASSAWPCHQNGAPIFAEEGWDETNANPRLEEALARHGDQIHGVSVHGGHLAAAAIDNATDRANLLSVYQAAWKKGCGSELAAAARCRGGLLLAMLQARMGPFAYFSPTTGLYRSYYLPHAGRAWSEQWPEGMHIPNPNLPNRDPFGTDAPLHIPPTLGGLARRAAAMVWRAPQGLNRVIIGLAESLPDRDLRRIDRHLMARSVAQLRPRVSYRGSCQRAPNARLGNRFSCRLGNEGHDDAEFAILLRIDSAGNLSRIDRIDAPDGTVFYTVSAQSVPTSGRDVTDTQRISLLQRGRALSLRTSDGSRLAQLELARDTATLSARLLVVQDFPIIETLIEKMSDAATRGEIEIPSPPRSLTGRDSRMPCCQRSAKYRLLGAATPGSLRRGTLRRPRPRRRAS